MYLSSSILQNRYQDQDYEMDKTGNNMARQNQGNDKDKDNDKDTDIDNRYLPKDAQGVPHCYEKLLRDFAFQTSFKYAHMSKAAIIQLW